MIYLITGTPGAGKTLRALSMALKFKDEGRAVYAHGLTDLDYVKAGFLPLPDPTKWDELPDNSVILGDECHEWIPQRDKGRDIPAHVFKLAKHRHRGFDFILTTQHGSQIDVFARRQVNSHHYMRKKPKGFMLGRAGALEITWDRYCEKPDDFLAQRKAVKSTFFYPKSIFGLYRSATMHTGKERVPLQVYGIGVLAIFTLWLMYKGVSSVIALAKGDDSQDTTATVTTPREGQSKASADSPSRGVVTHDPELAEYVRKWTPRVADIPSSAPAYDGFEVKQYPKPSCISTASQCVCITQQGTPLDITDAVCRDIARHGYFDPFMEPERNRSGPVEFTGVTEGWGDTGRVRSSDSAPRIGGRYVPPADTPTPSMWASGTTMFPERRSRR